MATTLHTNENKKPRALPTKRNPKLLTVLPLHMLIAIFCAKVPSPAIFTLKLPTLAVMRYCMASERMRSNKAYDVEPAGLGCTHVYSLAWMTLDHMAFELEFRHEAFGVVFASLNCTHAHAYIELVVGLCMDFKTAFGQKSFGVAPAGLGWTFIGAWPMFTMTRMFSFLLTSKRTVGSSKEVLRSR